MKRYSIYILAALFGCMLAGCANSAVPEYGDTWLGANVPRLVVSGCVINESAEPLQGIRIDIYGVREETEPDVLSYNYAFTDSAGMYVICRYLGREIPAEVTVVVTDPKEQYEEQTLFEKPLAPTVETFYPNTPTYTIEANVVLTNK